MYVLYFASTFVDRAHESPSGEPNSIIGMFHLLREFRWNVFAIFTLCIFSVSDRTAVLDHHSAQIRPPHDRKLHVVSSYLSSLKRPPSFYRPIANNNHAIFLYTIMTLFLGGYIYYLYLTTIRCTDPHRPTKHNRSPCDLVDTTMKFKI